MSLASYITSPGLASSFARLLPINTTRLRLEVSITVALHGGFSIKNAHKIVTAGDSAIGGMRLRPAKLASAQGQPSTLYLQAVASN